MPTSPHSSRSNRGGLSSRYRQAADLAVENLDWCINYLHQIRKHEIAKALHKNRMSIVKRYRDH